jgi:hypothetical protein
MPNLLRFHPNHTFTIVQFTDLHWKNGEPEDLKTRALMERVLELEKPDLVMLTGDVIEGERCADPAQSWREAVRPIVERKIFWAAVFGNHDDEGALSRRDLMAIQQSLPGCLSEPGPENLSGVGNYLLDIRASAKDQTAARLYCLDSLSYAEPKTDGYAWIQPDQIAWYLEQAQAAREANDGLPLPALAFFHIPLPEYNEIWDRQLCQGEKHETICCPHFNSGFFAALREGGDVLGTFVGHDHVNDFEGELDGIRLCYGRASGFNTYGFTGFERGARVIRLREGERGFESWLRLEKDEWVTG